MVVFVEMPRAIANAGISESIGPRYGIFSRSPARKASVPIFVNQSPNIAFARCKRTKVSKNIENERIICPFAHFPIIAYDSCMIVSYSDDQLCGTNDRMTYATLFRSMRKNIVRIIVVAMRNVMLATETNIHFHACNTFVALPEIKEAI